MAQDLHNPVPAPAGVLTRKLDAAAWGLFFIWTGIALLAGISWGVGLLGVGIIALAGQVARRYFGLTSEGFWVVVGLLFLAGGVWELSSIQIGLVPVLLLIAGAALLVSAVRGPRDDGGAVS